MTTRRILLKSLAATLFLIPAQAAAQREEFVRISLGGTRVTALYDGFVRLPARFFGGVPQTKIRDRYDRAGLDADAGAETAVLAFLIDDGKRRFLVDAGSGDGFGATAGRLMSSLHAAGYRPEDIDDILLTHMHPDHVCGLTKDGATLYPSATIWSAEAEAKYWLNGTPRTDADRNIAKKAKRALAPYLAKDRLRTFASGADILPGIRPLATPGHTPGHTAYLLTAGNESLLLWGDIVHVAAVQFAYPEATYAFDTDSALAMKSRKRLLRLVAEKGWRVAGAHLPFPGIGRVERRNGGYVWRPETVGLTPSSP